MQHHQNSNDTLHGMWGKSKNSKEQRESVILSRKNTAGDITMAGLKLYYTGIVAKIAVITWKCTHFCGQIQVLWGEAQERHTSLIYALFISGFKERFFF